MGTPWYGLQDKDKFVYHYTDKLALILNTGRFRLSKLANLNDPREAREWRLGFIQRASAELPSKEFTEELNNALKYMWRVGCFTSDPYESLVTKKREDLKEDILSALYERGHSNAPMWAHYGAKHAGACFVFDRAKLDAEIRKAANGRPVHAGKVEYRNPPIAPNLDRPHALIVDLKTQDHVTLDQIVDHHIARHLHELFFLKTVDWAYEREYRWIVRHDQPEEFEFDIRPALAGILLGDKISVDDKCVVSEFARGGAIALGIMGWANGVPQPEPTCWRLLCPKRPSASIFPLLSKLKSWFFR